MKYISNFLLNLIFTYKINYKIEPPHPATGICLSFLTPLTYATYSVLQINIIFINDSYTATYHILIYIQSIIT